MAESRRVQLTRLSCDVVPSSSDKPPASVRKSPSGVLQGKENGADGPADTDTVRLVITLSEPDERSFPEFSYSQLIENKTNHTKDEVLLNRFEEGEKRANDEVAALSRKFEEKYGGKPKTKKDRIQDLIDIGYGYDEEDSFIDNSEPASETDDLPTEEKTMEPPKKRKVNGRLDKPKKCCRERGEMMSNVDSKSSALSEIGLGGEIMKKKKKKNAVGTLSVTSMLKKFQREKEKERQKTVKNPMPAAIMGEVTIPLCPADAGGGGGSGSTDPLVSLIGSTNDHALIQAANTVDFDIDLDSLLDVSEETFSPKLVPQPGTETQPFRPKTDGVTPSDASPQVQPLNTKTNVQKEPHSEQMQLLSQTSSNSPHQCVPLPEGLAPQLEDSIQKLSIVAKTSEGESKLKFFTPEINSILLDIELQCRDQGGQLRSKVYTHLSSFLPCSRDTLLKRVKKLLLAHITEEPRDVEGPMQKLKEAIGRAMPEQIDSFNENCQVYEQLKKAAEEEKEGKQKVNVGPEDSVEEKGGRRGGPKKLFKWNEEIRESLCHVLRVKMERYKKERKGSQEMEEYLKTLLENEVKPLWPKGWMQSRLLIRESRKMLNIFASLPVKRARSEKRASISGPPTTSDGCSVLQGSSPLAGLPQDTDDVFIESSNISKYLPLEKQEAAALRKVEDETGSVTVDAGSSTTTAADKPRVSTTSSPTHSLLDLLAEQALAREQHFSVPQELLAAAVAKYKLSLQRCSFGVDTRSPPLAPPPPQSSPVGFPLSGMCKVALPQLLPVGDFTRLSDADHVQIISDDEDIIMQ
ncbi:ubinuclein-1-like isoform X2 [Etheostoma cragini]|uniref:ubinuclein-1-like isoform X2 n=1 Tax=Etheostoma cragini TaxID=417921 RepID=UPI00155E7F19|nr:ubinuclein-1-like isoform X2 [Etheostoma cragini]